MTTLEAFAVFCAKVFAVGRERHRDLEEVSRPDTFHRSTRF